MRESLSKSLKTKVKAKAVVKTSSKKTVARSAKKAAPKVKAKVEVKKSTKPAVKPAKSVKSARKASSVKTPKSAATSARKPAKSAATTKPAKATGVRSRTKSVKASKAPVKKITKTAKTTKAVKSTKAVKATKAVRATKAVKATKAAKPLKATRKATDSRTSKKAPKTRAVSKKKQQPVGRTRAATTRTAAKASPKPARVTGTKKAAGRGGKARATSAVKPIKRKKLRLPVVETPAPPPPEPPRRHLSAAGLKAFEHAVRVFNRRQYEDAKALFENLSVKFPQEVEIIARAQTYIHVCEQKVASAQSTPRSAEELYDRGVYALNTGDFSLAKSFFEKALRLQPDEPYLLYSLAATHAQTGADEQALDYLKRTIQMQPRFRTQALNDADFSGLRENRRFLEMLGMTSPFDKLEARK